MILSHITITTLHDPDNQPEEHLWAQFDTLGAAECWAELRRKPIEEENEQPFAVVRKVDVDHIHGDQLLALNLADLLTMPAYLMVALVDHYREVVNG